MKSEPQVVDPSDTPHLTEPEWSFVMILMMYFLFFVPSRPRPPSLPAGGVLLSKTHTSSDTWLTAGGRRDAGERRADTDTHSNQPSVVRLPQLCSCALHLHQSTSAE